MLNDCLITVKSGDLRPRNIADFMPDYNLWYAIKFMIPDVIVVLDNSDLTRDWPLGYYHTRISFISKWLSQVTGIGKVSFSYSLTGNWLSHFSADSKDIIKSVSIRGISNIRPAVFIDSLGRAGEDWMKTNYPGIDYLDKSEFIKYHNKNPRVYEKEATITRILGRR
jgi:hypothetical protein